MSPSEKRRAPWVKRRGGEGARRVGRRRRKACRAGQRVVPCPYQRRQALLSRGELAFYRVLLAALRGRFPITVKPRLADVIWCPPTLWRTPAGARVAQKHLDFVLYERATTAVVLAIELDDRSHARTERRARDAFVDGVLRTCDVPLLRVRAASRYDVEHLRRRIDARLSRHVGEGA